MKQLRHSDIISFIFSISAPRLPGEVARIVSPAYRATAPRCLQFWYHMYGSGIGTLRVYSQAADTGTKIGGDLFKKSGDLGDEWRVAHVSLPTATKAQVTILPQPKPQTPTSTQITNPYRYPNHKPLPQPKPQPKLQTPTTTQTTNSKAEIPIGTGGVKGNLHQEGLTKKDKKIKR